MNPASSEKMKDYEKAIKLARTIRTVAGQTGYGTDHDQKPTGVVLQREDIKPSTVNQVLAELNRGRKKKGLNLWTIWMDRASYPKSVMRTLVEQTDYNPEIIYFRPARRTKKSTSTT